MFINFILFDGNFNKVFFFFLVINCVEILVDLINWVFFFGFNFILWMIVLIGIFFNVK